MNKIKQKRALTTQHNTKKVKTLIRQVELMKHINPHSNYNIKSEVQAPSEVSGLD